MQSESALPPGHKKLKLDLTLSKFNLVYIFREYSLKPTLMVLSHVLDLQNFLFFLRFYN
jgi:hypothetical protein